MLGWFRALMPREEKFFDMFARHSESVLQGALALRAMLEGGSAVAANCQKVMSSEQQADDVTRDVLIAVRRTFITPFDPEDIQTLATTLDNVLDSIEDATFRIVAYRLDPIPEPAVQLGRMIDDCCQALSRALAALRARKPVWDDCIEVNRLENEADAVERTIVAKLFGSQIDPIALIKQKEVFEILENTTDICEDVADVIQNVAVKNS